jgi:N-acetylglucosaminyl-diphospho-decaprenol L-rhamnosyltransferase
MTDYSRIEEKLVISIVSHGQLALICDLLRDLQNLEIFENSIILTINIPEDLSALECFQDLPISIIQNEHPKGFGENHNTAFLASECDFFTIVNPDIRLKEFDRATLLAPFFDPDVGAVAPVVLSPAGHTEDSARRFPSLARLIKRTVFGRREPDYAKRDDPMYVDWVAGMFVTYRSTAFERVGGFDTRYFMYMEDADICLRLQRAGWRTVLQPACSVVHDAQRASRRSIRHLRWHLASAFRFLFLPTRKVPRSR